MKARAVAILLAVVTVVYLLIAVFQAVLLIRSGSVAAMLLGVGLLLLPVIGLVLVWREVLFGFHVQAMARALTAEDADRAAALAARHTNDAADAEFLTEQGRVQEDPDDWRAWYRLAAAYDAAKDRRRARAAMRYAYGLFTAKQ